MIKLKDLLMEATKSVGGGPYGGAELLPFKADFSPPASENISSKWGAEELFDYPKDPKTGEIAHGTPEMAKKLKSLRSKFKHGMPTLRGGKLVCSTCGKEYIIHKSGAVHPGTPAAKYLFDKGIIKRWK
jgi:hypothetical protein